MRGHRTKRLFPLLLAALLLRTLIPGGFMPASVSEGFFLALCHEGLSPALFAALTQGSRHNSPAPALHASEHHAHHHAHQPIDDTTNHHASGANHGAAFTHCEIGDGLSAAVAIDQSPVLPLPIATFRFALALRKGEPTANPHLSYQARGPPALHV
ncbi:MAG: hypothetical protein ACO3Z6_05965 [Pseudomonadales bacterium]